MMRPRRLRSLALPTPLPALDHTLLPRPLLNPHLLPQRRSLDPVPRDPARVHKNRLRVRDENQHKQHVRHNELVLAQRTGLKPHQQPLRWVSQEDYQRVHEWHG
jgi:hypothetical protein